MEKLLVLSICIATVCANYGYVSPPLANHQMSSSLSFNGNGLPSLTPFVVKSTTTAGGPAPQILRLHQQIRENQANNVRFETSNGIRSEDNTQILPGTPNPQNPSELWNKIAKSGFYSYTSPEGVPVNIRWSADGINGFVATGDAIPTPPPAPLPAFR